MQSQHSTTWPPLTALGKNARTGQLWEKPQGGGRQTRAGGGGSLALNCCPKKNTFNSAPSAQGGPRRMPGKTGLPSLPAKPLSVYNFDSDLHTGTQNEEGARQGERKKKKRSGTPRNKKVHLPITRTVIKGHPPPKKKVTLVDEESHTNVKSICRAGKSETSRQRGTGCMGVVEGGGGQSFAELPGRSQKTFSESPRLLLLRDAGIRLESKAASG